MRRVSEQKYCLEELGHHPARLWHAGKCHTISSVQGRGREELICSVFWFLWCKYCPFHTANSITANSSTVWKLAIGSQQACFRRLPHTTDIGRQGRYKTFCRGRISKTSDYVCNYRSCNITDKQTLLLLHVISFLSFKFWREAKASYNQRISQKWIGRDKVL
jgi:hypothetical protein